MLGPLGLPSRDNTTPNGGVACNRGAPASFRRQNLSAQGCLSASRVPPGFESTTPRFIPSQRLDGLARCKLSHASAAAQLRYGDDLTWLGAGGSKTRLGIHRNCLDTATCGFAYSAHSCARELSCNRVRILDTRSSYDSPCCYLRVNAEVSGGLATPSPNAPRAFAGGPAANRTHRVTTSH